MKFTRILISLIIGFIISYFLAVTFFNYNNYSSLTDRLFLLSIPAIAIGLLLAETFPSLSQWTTRIRSQYSLGQYFIGFLLALNFTYGSVGFLSEVIRTPFGMVLFTAIFISMAALLDIFLLNALSDLFAVGS